MARKQNTAPKARKPRAAKPAKAPVTVQQTAPAPEAPVEKVVRTVVKAAYKAKYKARGNPLGCGDWLHQTLDELTKPDGKTDREALVAILAANGVDHTKWKNTNVGLLRMSGGLALRAKVAQNDGRLVVPGEKKPRTAPADFVAKHAS